MSPRWLHWPAASSAIDYTTNMDGLYENTSDTTSIYELTTVTSSTAYTDTGGFRRAGSTGIQLYGPGLTGGGITNFPPYVALWFSEDGITWYWSVLQWNNVTGTSNRYAPVQGGTMPNVDDSVPHAIAYQTADATGGTNDTSSWTNYS
jgi:hypothetical protein